MAYYPYNLKDVHDASAQEKFKVISTFAGGGGSSTGYRLAGGKVLCVNEFVEEAVNTYRENYPDTHILPGDIKQLSGQDFLVIPTYHTTIPIYLSGHLAKPFKPFWSSPSGLLANAFGLFGHTFLATRFWPFLAKPVKPSWFSG